MKWIDQWISRWKHARILRECRRDGHFCRHSGELTPAVKGPGGVPVATGKAEFWFYNCRCGYTEINFPDMKDYYRPFAEAEKMVLEASKK